jgi:hypothetical protein
MIGAPAARPLPPPPGPQSDFSNPAGMLFQRRKLADGELWFFVNSTETPSVRARIDGKSIKLDLSRARPSASPRASAAWKSLELPPAGNLLLYARNTSAPAPPGAHSGRRSRRPRRSAHHQPPRANAVRIDYCDLKLNGATPKACISTMPRKRCSRHSGSRKAIRGTSGAVQDFDP